MSHTVKKIFFMSMILSVLLGCQSNMPPKNGLNPQAGELNRQLTVTYLKAGEVAKAKEKLNKALIQAPHSPQVLDTAAYFYASTGNEGSARKYFQLAIQEAPSAGRYHNNYGVYLCHKKQYREARDQFLMAAVDLNSTQVDGAYENAGLCAEAEGDKKAAVQYYQQALKINPKRENALLQLAKISYDSQQFTQARAYLKQYQHVAGRTPVAKELALKLDAKKVT